MTLSRLPSKCKHCRAKFTPEERSRGLVLHSECVEGWVKANLPKLEKKRVQLARKRAAEGRRVLRDRKQALKRLPELREEAQIEFRKFIRARDTDLPCVSCGETNPPMKPGGQWDAGHFLGRGAYPELAFEELNCWRQCKSCNGGGGKFAHKERTVNQRYEEELRRRIGDEKVDWLKGPHEAKKYTREDFERLKVEYRQKRKELERSRDD